MFARKKNILAAIVAAAGAVAATGSVHADHAEERKPLHAARGAVEVIVPADIVLDRARVLRRLDRALAEADELASLVQEVPYTRRHGAGEGREHVEAIFGVHGRRGPPRVDRDAIRVRAEKVRDELVRLRRMAERAPGVPVAEPVVVPIAPRDLAAFLRSLQHARFSDDKLALVRDLAGHANVTSVQAARIVREMPSWVQLEAALVLYEVTVDPAAYHRVYDVLRYYGDRERLRQRIARRHR